MPALPTQSPLENDDFCATVAAHLAAGGVAALPTDTVPGIAAVATTLGSATLADLKNAPLGRPFSLHLTDKAMLMQLLPSPPPGLAQWMSGRLPGRWTILLPTACLALDNWPQQAELVAAWGLCGLRLPEHEGWKRLAPHFKDPIIATSINQHGDLPLTGNELARWLGEHKLIINTLSQSDARGDQASEVVAFDPLPRLIRGNATPSELKPGQRVLLVCTGNICRSPMAEQMLRQALADSWQVHPEELAQLGWVIASAGTYAVPGNTASENAVIAVSKLNLHLDGHQAQLVHELDPQDWDLVLCMSPSHLDELPAGMDAKAELLDLGGKPVPDPYGGSIEIYELTRDHIAQALEQRLLAWSSWQ